MSGKTKARPQQPVPRIKPLLAENERQLRETGCLFGLQTLRRKQVDPGTYEAVWHILLNTMDAAWEVGCKVSASPGSACGPKPRFSTSLATRR